MHMAFRWKDWKNVRLAMVSFVVVYIIAALSWEWFEKRLSDSAITSGIRTTTKARLWPRPKVLHNLVALSPCACGCASFRPRQPWIWNEEWPRQRAGECRSDFIRPPFFPGVTLS